MGIKGLNYQEPLMEKSNWKPWCCIFWGENDKIYEVNFYVLECCLVQIEKNFGLVQMHKENNEESWSDYQLWLLPVPHEIVNEFRKID